MQRVVMNLGIGLGGVAGGFIASTRASRRCSLLDALTFVVYAVVLTIFVPDPAASGSGPSARAATGRSSGTRCSWR